MDKIYQICIGGEFRETEHLLPVMDIPTSLPFWQHNEMLMQIAALMSDPKDEYTQNCTVEDNTFSHGHPLEQQTDVLSRIDETNTFLVEKNKMPGFRIGNMPYGGMWNSGHGCKGGNNMPES